MRYHINYILKLNFSGKNYFSIGLRKGINHWDYIKEIQTVLTYLLCNETRYDLCTLDNKFLSASLIWCAVPL